MITVGTPALFASSTGRTSARLSSGASTMPDTPWLREALDDLHLLLAVVLAQRSLPDDAARESPAAVSSCAACTAPAWMLFQNSCVVPFGMTAIVSAFFAADASPVLLYVATTACGGGEQEHRECDIASVVIYRDGRGTAAARSAHCARSAVERDGEHDDHADDDLLDVVRPAHLLTSIAQEGHESAPIMEPRMLPSPPLEASAADDDGGDDVELRAVRPPWGPPAAGATSASHRRVRRAARRQRRSRSLADRSRCRRRALPPHSSRARRPSAEDRPRFSTIAVDDGEEQASIHTPMGNTSQACGGNVTSRSLTHVGGTFTVCSCASHFATPRAMPSMPSVTMNGTTFSLVITAAIDDTDRAARRRWPATMRERRAASRC